MEHLVLSSMTKILELHIKTGDSSNQISTHLLGSEILETNLKFFLEKLVNNLMDLLNLQECPPGQVSLLKTQMELSSI